MNLIKNHYCTITRDVSNTLNISLIYFHTRKINPMYEKLTPSIHLPPFLKITNYY